MRVTPKPWTRSTFCRPGFRASAWFLLALGNGVPSLLLASLLIFPATPCSQVGSMTGQPVLVLADDNLASRSVLHLLVAGLVDADSARERLAVWHPGLQLAPTMRITRSDVPGTQPCRPLAALLSPTYPDPAGTTVVCITDAIPILRPSNCLSAFLYSHPRR